MTAHTAPASVPQPGRIDDAAVVWSADPADLGDATLVVLLHGRGSHERDLVSLIPMLPASAVYASLRAPHRNLGGYSWFVSGEPGEPDSASAVDATLDVLAWLDRVAPTGPVVVVGFSQGGAMATQLLRHAPERFAALVSLAGFTIAGAGAGDAADVRLAGLAVPLFWGRDPDDPVIPQAAVQRTAEFLPQHCALTVREYPGVGHSVSAEEMADVSAFIEAAIAARGTRP